MRRTLHRLRLPYALGISPTLTVFRGTPTLRVDRTQPPPRNRRGGLARPRRRRRPRAQRRLPAAGVAARRVAQRDQSAVGSRLRGAARHAGHRLAPAPARARGLAALRARPRARRGAGDTTWCRCRRPPRSRSSCDWRISAGRSNSTTKTSRPNSGLDHFEGRSYPGWQHHMVDQRRRLRVSPDRAAAPPRGPAADVSAGARLRPRNLYGAAVDQSPSIHALDESKPSSGFISYASDKVGTQLTSTDVPGATPTAKLSGAAALAEFRQSGCRPMALPQRLQRRQQPGRGPQGSQPFAIPLTR